MEDANKVSLSDDEEDLAALRLAALQSLKKKNAEAANASLNGFSAPPNNFQHTHHYSKRQGVKGNHHKRGRFYGPHQGRGVKNGHFNNGGRVRNTNLISITPVDEEGTLEKESCRIRYVDRTEKTEETSSKFDRYNNSDESESESECEKSGESESESPGKLERADSLEALMQELDDEIQGKPKSTDDKPVKLKVKVKKPKQNSNSESVSESCETKETDQKDIASEEMKSDETNSDNIKCEDENPQLKENLKPDNNITEHFDTQLCDTKFSPQKKVMNVSSRSPMNRRGNNRRRPKNFNMHNRHFTQDNLNANNIYEPIPLHFPPQQFTTPPLPFGNVHPSLFVPPNIGIVPQIPPPVFGRPISPLSINTEALTTATLAPLSPRSAAFVMENRAIIEKRKRSPRRSYSRSPSPKFRRSKSPRRSNSPRRSLTPRRSSLSPRRKSRSPRRRSLSPVTRKFNNKKEDRQKLPVHTRLGLKPNKVEDEVKDKVEILSPKKENIEEPKEVDPVLEARKRKFETNEIKVKEGVIRLKPKEENKNEDSFSNESIKEKVAYEQDEDKAQIDLEKLAEDALLEGDDIIELVPKVDDIFSDEDSASDNEGRFKTKLESNEKVPVLSFSKLVSGEKPAIKKHSLEEERRKSYRDRRQDRKNVRRHHERKPKTPSPVNHDKLLDDLNSIISGTSDDILKLKEKNEPKEEKAIKKDRIKTRMVKPEKVKHVPPQKERRFDRKIEIKIKNPSKYEKGAKSKVTIKENSENLLENVNKRKVELGKKKIETEEEDPEPEIIVENDESNEDENATISEGDLRAQLSKKRAERLNKYTPADGAPSRLLQSAFEGVVFKKSKLPKSHDLDITNSDGKKPIHLRLGIANNSDLFTDTKMRKKSRKRKNRAKLEQV